MGTPYNSASSGNWSAANTWSPNGVPGIGDTATIAAGHVVTLDQDVTDLAGLTVRGELAWGTLGKTLRMAGNLTCSGTGVVTGGPGGVLEFDNAGRSWVNGWNYEATYPIVRTVGTTAEARFTIRTVAGGTNAWMDSIGRTFVYDLAHVDVLRMGDATNKALYIVPQGSSDSTLDDVTFDQCGNVQVNIYFSTGVTLSRSRFLNNLADGLVLNGNGGTGQITVDQCTFESTPWLLGNGSIYTDNYFHRGWQASYSDTAWATFDGNLVRQVQPGTSYLGYALLGPMDDSVWIVDTDNAPTSTGSVSSATDHTLTDATAPWTDGQFYSTTAVWMLYITGGTGAGQARQITGNTSTTLSLAGPAWVVPLDATSTYAVVPHIFNPHQTVFGDVVAGPGSIAITGNVWWGSHGDGNGECIYAIKAGGTYQITRNLFLRNIGLDCCGDGITLLAVSATVALEHNTFFSGIQSLVQHSENGNTPAGTVASLRSNLVYRDPTSPYSGTPFSTGLMIDVSHTSNPSSGVQDVVAPGMADYNGGYGLTTGNAALGYDGNFSVTPGAHDVHADPQFVNVNATPLSWAVEQGITASVNPLVQLGDLLAAMRADPSRTRAELLPYLRAAFTPTNPAFATAAHDGTTIGALELPTTPAAPSGLMATAASSSQIDLAWTDNSDDETGFVLERSLDGSTGWTQIATPAANTGSYSDTGLTAETAYFYRVKAVNDAGSSAVSATATATTAAPDVNSPTNLQGYSTSDFEVFLTWDRANDNETAVLVERSGDGSTWNTVATLPASENLWFDRSLWPGSTYQWRVSVVIDGQTSEPSAPVTVTVLTSEEFRTENERAAPLSLPSDAAATNLDRWTNQLTWTEPNPTNQAFWVVDRSDDGGLTYRTRGTTPNIQGAMTWTDRYLTPGTTYLYRMRLDSGDTGISDILGPFTATTPALGALPAAATLLCSNTYQLDLGGASGGSFTLTIRDGMHGGFSAITPSLPFDATASAIRDALRTLCGAWEADRNLLADVVVIQTSSGQFLIGLTDGALLIQGDGSGLTGGSLAVTERQTATNSTLIWEDQTGGAASYKIEAGSQLWPTDANYDSQFAQVGTTATGIAYFDLTTTAESYYLVRVRPNTGSGDGGSCEPVAIRTPSAGSALTLTVGPGETYTSLGEIPWTTVGPGSVISVAYGTYNEVVMIGVRGTLTQPIVIQGVTSGGNRPVLSGVGATTNAQFKSPAYPGFGVLLILNRSLSTGVYGTQSNRGWCAGNLFIKNLELTGAYQGDSGGLTCTDSEGATVPYIAAASGLYCAGGENLYVENLYAHGNGNGLFARIGSDYFDTLNDAIGVYGRNLVIRDCLVSQNGNPGSDNHHECYLEIDGLLAEGCRFGPGRGNGSSFKTRSGSLVFRYNVVNGCGSGAHLLDLIDPYNHAGIYATYPDAQKEDWVYGNALYNPPIYPGPTGYGSASPIHIGGDSGSYSFYKRVVRWYANTYVYRRDSDQPYSYTHPVFIGKDNAYSFYTRTAIDVRRSIFHGIPDQGTRSPLELRTDWAFGYFNNNTCVTGWTQGFTHGLVAGLANITTLADPQFADMTSDPPDLRLTAGSACIDAATSRLPQIAIDRQPATLATVARTVAGAAPDLGAFEFTESIASSFNSFWGIQINIRSGWL